MCEGDGMEEWKECKLGDIVEIHRGASPRPIQKFIATSGMPWVKISDATASNSRFINSTKEFIIEDGISKSVIVNPEDLIVSNSATPGLPKIMKIKACIHDGWLYFSNYKNISRDFLYYKFFDIQKHLTNLANGSVFQNLKTDIVKDFTIKLPPLPTQQKIAAILSSLDDKIELNNTINTNLEQQAGALFKNWFVDFEPFGGKMPEGWKVGKLSDISILSAGGDKPKEVSDKITEDYKVPIYSNGLDNFGLYGYTNKAKIFEESVTVSARGTIGFVCLRMVPYVPIVRLISLIPKTDFVSAKYLYLHLLNCNITGTGTTQQQLTVPAFSKEQIIIPSKNAIDSFTNTVNPFFETIVHNRKENEKLSSMRDTLLPKLMNGEIKVDEVRK